jgi:hypothetical protein
VKVNPVFRHVTVKKIADAAAARVHTNLRKVG